MTNPYEAVFDFLCKTCAEKSLPPAEAARRLRDLLSEFEVLRKGMRCTGQDNGSRPIHLVIVGVSCMRLAQDLLSNMTPFACGVAQRLAAITIAAARDHIVEFRGARRLIHTLASAGALPDTSRWRLAVEPGSGSSSGSTNREGDGFLAQCSNSEVRRVELRRVVTSLISDGFASSTNALPDAFLLAEAEREARRLHDAGAMFSSTVKNGKNTGVKYYQDAKSRGDLIRWLDGTDALSPACSALTQWLRGELMDAVREACDAAPPGANSGAGTAAKLSIEAHTNLPLAMLACYPGGGAQFVRHVDNSPEASDLRAVTAILYLNGGWTPADGGALRVYGIPGAGHGAGPGGGEAYQEVEPRRGTLVIFWSHVVPHAVMPAGASRYALSMWLSIDPQKQQPGWLEWGRRRLVQQHEQQGQG